MRHGFTLLETVMVLAVLGLTLGIAAPHIASMSDRLAVEQAAHQLVAAHRRARITSIVRSRSAVLTVGPDSFAIRLAGDAADTWASSGPAAWGVALAGPIRRLTFSPVGITTGLSNATFRLSRGTAVRTIVVSRLGRLRRAVP
jgi:prepilin-type N-terminal cleavage/methylation domain-containing protein